MPMPLPAIVPRQKAVLRYPRNRWGRQQPLSILLKKQYDINDNSNDRRQELLPNIIVWWKRKSNDSMTQRLLWISLPSPLVRPTPTGAGILSKQNGNTEQNFRKIGLGWMKIRTEPTGPTMGLRDQQFPPRYYVVRAVTFANQASCR